MPMRTIDPDFDVEEAHAAFAARARSHDGHFVGAVTTTGIYCKPSCPARRPKREHLLFFRDGAAARAEGFRPCKRCRPDEVARDAQAVASAIRMIQQSEEPLHLARLAGAVGYAPHHFQRLFTRAVGVSPAAYARALRAKRTEAALQREERVTDAIYDGGHNVSSSFYADARGRLGMTPSAWRDGGKGSTIHFVVTDSPLGPLLVAATDKGICRLSFDEGEDALRRRFPKARILPDDGIMAPLVEGVLTAIREPANAPNLPLDVRGTAFQERVWAELRKIPLGQTRSYSDIASAVGSPGAVRAVGTANGSNPVSVLVPCHRVIRSDGSLGGYGGGLATKARLLAAEGVVLADPELPLGD